MDPLNQNSPIPEDQPEPQSPAEPIPAPEPEDDFDEAWPEEETPEPEATPLPSEDYLPPPGDMSWRETRRPRCDHSGALAGVLLALLAVGLVAVTAWAALQYRQRALVLGAAQQAVALIGEGAPKELASEISAINASLTSGHPEDAATRLAGLRSLLAQRQQQQPAGGDEGEGAPIPEAAYSDLPADAAAYFRQNEKLFRRFLVMCNRARQMRDQGQNVDALRKVRDQVIEAARLGQTELVRQHMTQMLRMLGGGKGRAENPLRAKAQRLKAKVQRARSQGRDIRAVLPLMRQAEEAAQSGNMAAAEKYLDRALAAADRAPRRGARYGDARRRLFAGGRGPRANPLAPFVRVLLGVMMAEEQDLKQVTNNLLDMRGVLTGEEPREQQPDKLKPLLDKALSELNTVSQRRQQLTMKMRGKPGQPGKNLLPADRPRPTPEERRSRMALIMDRVGELVDRIRALPEEEYQKQKRTLVRDLVRAVVERPQPQSQPQPKVYPSDPAERVKAKMLEAAPTVKQWELEGKDTTKVDELFTQARKALYAGDCAEAEKLVDEARVLLGLEPPPAERAPSATKPPMDEPIKLDLRGR